MVHSFSTIQSDNMAELSDAQRQLLRTERKRANDLAELASKQRKQAAQLVRWGKITEDESDALVCNHELDVQNGIVRGIEVAFGLLRHDLED